MNRMNRLYQPQSEVQATNAMLDKATPSAPAVNMMLAAYMPEGRQAPPRYVREHEDLLRRGEFDEKWELPWSEWMPIDPRDPRTGLPPESQQELDSIQLEEMQKGARPDDIDRILRHHRERLKREMPPPWKPW